MNTSQFGGWRAREGQDVRLIPKKAFAEPHAAQHELLPGDLRTGDVYDLERQYRLSRVGKDPIVPCPIAQSPTINCLPDICVISRIGDVPDHFFRWSFQVYQILIAQF